MSKKISRVVALGVAVATVFSLVIGSVQSASAHTGNTESSLKSALQYAMLYQCAQDYGNNLFAQTAIGEKTSSIINDYSSYTEYIGTAYELGDSNGNITCRKLVEDVFGAGKISDSTVSRGLLKGVYEYAGSSEKKISCSYGIINSEKSGMIDNGKEYYWPAGYYDGANGFVNQTGHGAISVVYDENGPIRLEGATSDVDVEHALASLRNRITDWKRDDTICSSIVEATEIYSYQAPSIQDPSQTITTYTPIRSNTCDAMESVKCFWLNGNNTENAAWINKASPVGYWYHIEDVADATKLIPTDDAATNFKANIQSLFLDGSAGLAAFLNDHPDAKYLLYGRYLFNGDNGNSSGCRVTAVPKSDITGQKIDTTYWDTSLSYIKEFSPWNDSGTKVDYVGKIGGNGVAEPGDASLGVTIPGGTYGGRDYKTCSVLMDDFKSVIGSVSGSAAKKTVYSYIGAIPATELPDSNDPSNPGSTGGQPEENQPVDKCYTAAASLGWFLCPVLDVTSKATTGIYEFAIKPFLEIKSEFFDANSHGGGLRNGWSSFRNFANILFAIAFAVVIFSQVTGIGISNYNIKKILPRLIMVVVLVNISFILCQLAVDISNILGSSLQKMFTEFAKGVGVPSGGVFTAMVNSLSGEETNWFSLSGLISTAITSGLLVGAGALLVVSWEIWLVPFLLAVLACFISVIFFFLILGVRQAGILILIAIAPVAIVCYALPNTKSFYDKWFKVFSALLMVYPICGVLIGGGQFASALLVSTGDGNFLFMLVAMLVSVVPFFFIPSILRSSMVAMGNLGAKMAAMGSGLGNKATGLLRNSSAVQDRQRQNMIHYNEKKTRGLLRKQERNGGLSAGNQRKLARYGSALNRLKAEDIQAQLSAQSGNFAVAGSAAESRMRQSMQTRQEHDDIAAQQQIYESNGVDGVDINDMGSLATEYESQLDALDGAIASGDAGARDEALMRVKALQNILSKTDAGRGHIQNALNHRLSSNADMYNSNNGEDTALSMAAGHLMANYANDYKKSNRGLYSMLQDLSGRQYTKGMTVSGGHATYKPSFYNTSGIASYTAQTLAGADENAINGIADSIDTMSDSDLETATSLANEALSNPKIELQPKVKSQLQKIVAGGYARGAMSHSTNPGVSTVGSSMISQASSQSLDNVISRIQDGDPLTQMTADQVRNVAENARRALESDSTMHDEGTAERLQQVLAAAKARGIKDIDGNNFDPVDSATIKIRGQRQPKAMTKAPVPAGWTEGGLWTGPGTPTKKQQIAYDEWAKHSAEVDRHNSSIPPTP